jgi:hypothetical protein
MFFLRLLFFASNPVQCNAKLGIKTKEIMLTVLSLNVDGRCSVEAQDADKVGETLAPSDFFPPWVSCLSPL